MASQDAQTAPPEEAKRLCIETKKQVCHLTDKIDVELTRSILCYVDILECHQTALTCQLFADACRKMPRHFYRRQLVNADRRGGPRCALGGPAKMCLFGSSDPSLDLKQVAISSGLAHCNYCDELTTRSSREFWEIIPGVNALDVATDLLKLEEGEHICAICIGDRLVLLRYNRPWRINIIDEYLKAGLKHKRVEKDHENEDGSVVKRVFYVFVQYDVQAFQDELERAART